MFQRFKNWWNGLCPKHGIEYKTQGFYDDKYCPSCWDEMMERHKNENP